MRSNIYILNQVYSALQLADIKQIRLYVLKSNMKLISTAYETNKVLDMLFKVNNTGTSLVMIVRDFNFPEINWEMETVSKSINHIISQKFLNTVRDAFLYQNVNEPNKLPYSGPDSDN